MPDELEIHAVPHPDPAVRQVGFPLEHPYIEHCVSPVIGPTATLLVRRLPLLWREREPAIVPVRDLSRSLGLGTEVLYRDNRIWRTIDRLGRYGLATRLRGDQLKVHVTVRPLTPHQLERLPEWTRQAHDRLLGEHLDLLARAGTSPVGDGRQSQIAARLERLERQPRLSPMGLQR